MNARQTKSRVRQYIEALRIPADLTGASVLIAEYVSAQELRMIKPDDSVTWREQQLLNRFFGRLMRKRGACVEFVTIRAEEYFGWLGDRPNTPDARAEFGAWKRANAN